MQCTSPVHGYYAQRMNPTGKRSVVFLQSSGFTDMPVTLPCGRCLGCRMEYARQWAVRCEHEIKCHAISSFITLTYSERSVPYTSDGLMSLDLADVTKFWKRLRKRVGVKLRYFQCGEYGDKTARPHYHALVFGWYPSDCVYYGDSNSGEKLYSSEFVESVWGFGRCTVQEATWATANYVARYVTKKVVDKHDASDSRVREFLTMSRRPGIGQAWAALYLDEWYARDSLVANGKEMRPPKYYEGLLEKRSPALLRFVKAQRRKVAAEMECKRVNAGGVTHHSTDAVRVARVSSLKRELE